MRTEIDLLRGLVIISNALLNGQVKIASDLALELLENHYTYARLWRLLERVGLPFHAFNIQDTQIPIEISNYEEKARFLQQRMINKPENVELRRSYNLIYNVYVLRVAVFLDNNDPSLALSLAIAESLLNYHRESEKNMDVALNICPEYEDALISASSFVHKRLFDERWVETAIKRLELATEINPENSFAYDELADLYSSINRPSEVERCRRSAFLCQKPLHSEDPALMRDSNPNQIIFHLQIGNKLRLYNQYHAAIDCYLSVIKRFGWEPNLCAIIAYCYFNMDDTRYENVNNINVEKLLYSLARRKEAGKLVDRPDLAAVEISLRNPPPFTDHESSLDEAISWSRRAVDAEPDNARWHAQLGKFLANHDPHGAAAEYFEAISINPKFGSALFEGANLYEKVDGRISLAQAIDWNERALRVSPDNPTYYFQLGNLYLKAKREDEAIKAWSKALLCQQPLDEQHTRIIKEYCGTQE